MASMTREILLDTVKRAVVKFILPESGGNALTLTGSVFPSELTGYNRGNINETPELGISRISYCLPYGDGMQETPWLTLGWGKTGQSATGASGSIFLNSSGILDYYSMGCLLRNTANDLTYYAVLGLTGVTSGTFSGVGAVAYHLTGSTNTVPDYSGIISSFTGSAAGPTGTLTLSYPYSSGVTAGTFSGITGYMSLSSTGNVRYLVNGAGSVYSGSLYDGSICIYNFSSTVVPGYMVLELVKIKGYGINPLT